MRSIGEGGIRTMPFSGFILNDLARLLLARAPNFPPCDLAMNLFKFNQLGSIRKENYGFSPRNEGESFDLAEMVVPRHQGEVVLDGHSSNPNVIFGNRLSFLPEARFDGAVYYCGVFVYG